MSKGLYLDLRDEVAAAMATYKFDRDGNHIQVPYIAEGGVYLELMTPRHYFQQFMKEEDRRPYRRQAEVAIPVMRNSLALKQHEEEK